MVKLTRHVVASNNESVVPTMIVEPCRNSKERRAALGRERTGHDAGHRLRRVGAVGQDVRDVDGLSGWRDQKKEKDRRNQ